MLQHNLDKLTVWSDTWLLRFLSDKYNHMHIGKHNPDPIYKYALLGRHFPSDPSTHHLDGKNN